MSQEHEYEIHVDQINTEIECESCIIPKDEQAGIQGGIALTGFIDVEKIITVKYNHHKKKLFLEKKLPFQIVILNLSAKHTEPKVQKKQ
ncbi:hypothetical protein [Bacillus mycoides]|uniref:hypothetical protein n=1 Tax=Bacillus mycoides TaxID=1405 RepID=UPI003D07FB57